MVACIFGGSIRPGSLNVTDLAVTGLVLALVAVTTAPDGVAPFVVALAIRVASLTS